MPKTRPFAYNTGAQVEGSTKYGDISVGGTTLQYSTNPGGLEWWMGPDEDLGYVICQTHPTKSQPAANGTRTSHLSFQRVPLPKTEGAFVAYVNAMRGRAGLPQDITTGGQAATWLFASGYWTSYIVPGSIYPDGQIAPEPYGPIPSSYMPDFGTFSTGGSDNIYSIAIDDEGSYYVGGIFTTYGGVSATRIVKIDSSGTIDGTFNSGSGFNNIVRRVSIGEYSGDLFVTGSFTSYNGTACNRNARINPTTGSFIRSYTMTSATISYQLKELPDGRVFAGGNANSGNNNKIYLSDGTLDTSFTFTPASINDLCYSFHSFPDGKYLWSGSSSSTQVRILNSNGSVDTSATANLGSPNGYISAYVTDNDGWLYGTGTFSIYGGVGGFGAKRGVIKFKSDGVYDNTFGNNILGQVGSNSSAGLDWYDKDNGIMALSSTMGGVQYPYYPNNASFILFDTSGIRKYTDNYYSQNLFTWASVGISGGVVFGGSLNDPKINAEPSTENLYAAEINETSYNSAVVNVATFGTGVVGTVYAIEKYQDNKLLIGGSISSYNGIEVNSNLIRINEDGTLDFTFKPTEIAQTVRKILYISKNDTVLVAGDFGLKAYNGDGSENSDWTATFDGPVKSFSYNPPKQGVVICGGFTKGLRKFSIYGVEDTTFYSNLGTGFSGGNVNDCWWTQGDQRIYCVGTFTSQNGVSTGGYGVINATGVPVTGFTTTGFTGEPLWLYPKNQNQGFYVGGTITSIAGSATNNFGFIYTNGTSDNSTPGSNDGWTRPNSFGGPTYGMTMMNYKLNLSTFNLVYFVYGSFSTYKIGEEGYGMKTVNCNNIACIGSDYYSIPDYYPEGLGASGPVYAGLAQVNWATNIIDPVTFGSSITGGTAFNNVFGGSFTAFGSQSKGGLSIVGVTGQILA